MSLTTGTAKSGRWTYPAVMLTNGVVNRNTKRDGTGSFTEPVTNGSFVADVPDVPATETPDRTALRAVHLAIFNSGIWADEDDIQVEDPAKPGTNLTPKRALELARALVRADLAVEEKSSKDDGFKTGRPIWMSSPNWDEVNEAESLAIFERTVPFDITVAAPRTRADKPVNNTHAKPGRSSWAVGTPCPQGHVLGADDVYVMPSGRKQCRQCRRGYSSNV